jgi:hypothetical protein
LALSPVSRFAAPNVPPLPTVYLIYRGNSYPSFPVDYKCFLPFDSLERYGASVLV